MDLCDRSLSLKTFLNEISYCELCYSEKLAYALRKDLAWREVKNELPTGANYKDATKKFTGWSPALQSDGEAGHSLTSGVGPAGQVVRQIIDKDPVSSFTSTSASTVTGPIS